MTAFAMRRRRSWRRRERTDRMSSGFRFFPARIWPWRASSAPSSRPPAVSQSHLARARELGAKLKSAGLSDVKIVVGGIVPAEDQAALKSAGIAAVFSPKDYDLNAILRKIVGLVQVK